MSDNWETKPTTIYLRGLTEYVTKGDIQQIFSKMGEIEEIEILALAGDHHPKDSAFVTYKTAIGAIQAYVCLSGVIIRGNPIKVQMIHTDDEIEHSYALVQGILKGVSQVDMTRELGQQLGAKSV